MKVLIVEDQVRIAENIKLGLEKKLKNAVIDIVHTAAEGVDYACDDVYDCIILDRMLPDFDGAAAANKIRSAEINTPILMLTAKNRLDDRVSGLEAGVDDYLGKPFELDELVARIQALTRRINTEIQMELVFDSLVVKPNESTVMRAGKHIDLSSTEFRLLTFLLKHPNQKFTAETIIEKVWAFDTDILPNTVQVFMGYLRKKIDKAFPNEKPIIQTARGFGYYLGTK